MPIVIVKGLPAEEEARQAALKLKKKLKKESRKPHAPRTHIENAIDVKGGKNSSVESFDSDDGSDHDTPPDHFEGNLSNKANNGAHLKKDPTTALYNALDESAESLKQFHMKQREPSPYLTPLNTFTDLFTLKVYSVSRQGPWDTAPPTTRLLGESAGLTGLGEVRRSEEEEEFERRAKEARFGHETVSVVSAPHGAGIGVDSSAEKAAQIAGNNMTPTVLQRLRYLRAKSSYTRPAPRYQRMSELVQASELRKLHVQHGTSYVGIQGATDADAISPKGYDGKALAQSRDADAAPASVDGGTGGNSARSSTTDLGINTMHTISHSQSTQSVQFSAMGADADTAIGSTVHGYQSSRIGDHGRSASPSGFEVLGGELDEEWLLDKSPRDQIEPEMSIFKESLRWAMATTSLQENILLETLLKIDSKVTKFATQRAEAEVWWNFKYKRQLPQSVSPQGTSGAAQVAPESTTIAPPTLANLALFSMHEMQSVIEQEREQEQARLQEQIKLGLSNPFLLRKISVSSPNAANVRKKDEKTITSRVGMSPEKLLSPSTQDRKRSTSAVKSVAGTMSAVTPGKHKSLLQQLQILSEAGKDAFVKAITVVVPMSPKGRSSPSSDAACDLFKRGSPCSPARGGAKSKTVTASSEVSNSSPRHVHIIIPSEEAIVNNTGNMKGKEGNFSTSTHGLSMSAVSDIPSPSRPVKPVISDGAHVPTTMPASPIRQSLTELASERPVGAVAHAPTPIPAPPAAPQPSRRPSVPRQRQKHKVLEERTGPVRYTSISNAAATMTGLENTSHGHDSGDTTVTDKELPAAVQDALNLIRKTEAISQAQLKVQLDSHKKQVEAVHELALKAFKKMTIIEHATSQMAQNLQDFSDNITKNRERVENICIGKEFAYQHRNVFRLKQELLTSLEAERSVAESHYSPRPDTGAALSGAPDKCQSGTGGGGGSIQATRDMQLISKRAKRILFWQSCERLHKAAWLWGFVPTLRDLVRRANVQGAEPISPNAIRFLSVVYLFVTEGIELDAKKVRLYVFE